MTFAREGLACRFTQGRILSASLDPSSGTGIDWNSDYQLLVSADGQ